MKSLSIGFTLQIADYEPVKINVMHERDAVDGETPEEHEINLAKEVVGNLKNSIKDSSSGYSENKGRNN